MTIEKKAHGAFVAAWMGRAAPTSSPEQLIHVLELGFGALWRRAHQTLSDVTLTAIVDRVLSNAADRYPFLAALEIETTALRCQKLRESAVGMPRDQLAEGLRFVLTEFLTVLGSLTAEILTPALHGALDRVALDESGAGEPAPGEARNPALKNGEDVK